MQENEVQSAGERSGESEPSTVSAEHLFTGRTEMHARGRELDWAATPLGPVSEWPGELRTFIRGCLESPFPMSLWCGPSLALIYNDAYRRVLGARHPGAFGRPGAEVWSEIWEDIRPYFDGIRAGGPPVLADNSSFRMRRAGQLAASSPRLAAWITYSISPIRDGAGAIIAFLTIVSEIPQRALSDARLERQQEELEQANQRLQENATVLEAQTEELQRTAAQLAERTREAEAARGIAVSANRLKSEFLATMSHEFRTPLNAILGYAQLLDMGVLGPATAAQHAHLVRLEASARHLLQLVDDVLDVAKVDADRLEVRQEPQRTSAAVADAVALVQPQATGKGVRVTAPGTDAVDVWYVGDEHRVRQILVNLLSNAIKFTDPGGSVTISGGIAEEIDPGARVAGKKHRVAGDEAGHEHEWAFIRVDDTGAGIAPDLIAHLFEPFVQGNGALTREQGGTGLGLAISHRLARLMGGDLTVHSKPGDGASFTLWLPTARPGAEPQGTAARATGTAGPGLPVRGRRIVLATDSASGSQLDDDGYALLHQLGSLLSAAADSVAERFVAALRADEIFPGARELPSVQLRDHATPLIGLVASQLMVIGETHGTDPQLLSDSGQAQRFMSELHGAQRYRMGWGEGDIERETPLLIAEVEREIQVAAVVGTAVGAPASAAPAPDEGETGTPSRSAISPASAHAAARYAEDVARHVLEQGMHTAVRAHRFARAAGAP